MKTFEDIITPEIEAKIRKSADVNDRSEDPYWFDQDVDLMEELYEYYLNSGEMPYGVAKARDGDPDQWIGDQVYKDLGI
jgi:hypothetical protein